MMLPLNNNHLAECEFCFSGGNHYRDFTKTQPPNSQDPDIVGLRHLHRRLIKKKHGH